MRGRTSLVVVVGLVAVVSFVTYAPRLGQPFPSMVDDWNAIAATPAQLHEVLRLGNPEDERYRPGWVMWNALQWHTLGAPSGLVGPQVWGVLRWLVLVVGLALLTALLVGRDTGRRGGLDPRLLLVAGVPLVVLTPASIAVDIARFGPQEPLMVGCMSLGAVLLVRAADRLLRPEPARAATVALVAGGLVLWAFGVLQKETSACMLLLAPFLWPTLQAERERWVALDRGRRRAIALVAAGILLPFVPIVARTLGFALAGKRVYEDAVAAKSFHARLSDQLGQAAEVLHTRVTTLLVVAALALLVLGLLRFGVDWLSTGLLAVALGFLVFAAESGVVASRYLIPFLALLALAIARLATRFGREMVVAAGVVMIAGALWQAHDARRLVVQWVEGERAQEALVREAAGRVAGGCTVDVTGLNVELVRALPVLMRLVDEPPRDCVPGTRYLVVIDAGGPGVATTDANPVYAACAADPTPSWTSNVGTILRCTS